jgi:hypothetical protein
MALDLGIFLEGAESSFKVKVSSNDTQPNYLINKLTSSDASVTITETNDGGIEVIDLTSSSSSPLTTKGDLYTFDSSGARLAVGTDGQALVADSTQPTGLKWDTVSADNFATADLTLTGNRTHDLNGNVLTLDNGQTIIKGAGSTSATTSLLVENSGGTDLLKIDDSGGFALGAGALYTNDSNVSIGKTAEATGDSSISIGVLSDAKGTYDIAIGRNSSAEFGYGVAIGQGATIIAGNYGVAIGSGAASQNLGGIAVGTNTDATVYALALGYVSQATGDSSTAIGRQANSSGAYSTSIGGRQTKVTVSNSIFLSASSTTKTLATANVFAVNLNNANNVLQIGQTTDSYYSGTGSFGFGTTSPSSSAVVDFTSTTKGVLMPRMTAAQGSAITGVDGLMIYVTDTDATFTSVGFWGYESGSWVKL